ncbi:charged multivesicular body protein 2a homolog 2-like [Schistocerca gregaria]|uniref:charged multivesicular body protein 2a homolog 2-like n=1 Tax=Schistocerca gregaria TaxID=7010 RepID=UPI00211DC11C|nr:charged multivesicular body protein 2a homolog 2-like [Schistocerca gregaria]
MGWLFGTSPAEQVKQHLRVINRTIRELDRECNRLQRDEKKAIIDIKKVAKAGQLSAAKIMAKDLVRTRKHIEKVYKMKVQLQAVSMRLQTINSQHLMVDAIRGVTKSMARMNSRVNLPAMQNIMVDFMKQNEMLEGKEELVTDAMDDTMDYSDEESETEEIVNQVLDEIGINLEGALSTRTSVKTAGQESTIDAEDMDLQNRFENLRK